VGYQFSRSVGLLLLSLLSIPLAFISLRCLRGLPACRDIFDRIPSFFETTTKRVISDVPLVIILRTFDRYLRSISMLEFVPKLDITCPNRFHYDFV